MMLSLLVVLSCLVIQNESARILAMYPVPSLSHQVVFRPLMIELAKRGHEVVVITPDPVDNPPANMTQLDVREESYKLWREVFLPTIDGDLKNSFKTFVSSMHAFVQVSEVQFQTKVVQDLLKSGQKFDVIFVEAMTRSPLVLSHIFKAPVIMFSSLSTFYPQGQIVGIPTHLFLYPEIVRKRLYNLSLHEKLVELYYDLRFRKLIHDVDIEDNKMIKRNFGPDVPEIFELANNVDMIFLNVNPIWDDNKPVPPGVIYTGGLHVNPKKDLPSELKSYLDNSKNGVIYMSFGSNVDPTTLDPERIKVFCEVFSKLPYDVLWKWNGDVLPGKPANVRISKWLPQSDLLDHPKVKVFLTQAGLQSTDEAITAEVPLIAFPIFADQWYNAEKYEKLGIGIRLDFETFTAEQLDRSIRTLIDDKSYKVNIAKLSRLFRDQPMKPLERVVWWTEHLLRHGGARHMRCPQANSSWSEYLMLDVVLFFVSVIIALMVFLVCALKWVCGLFKSEKVKLKTK